VKKIFIGALVIAWTQILIYGFVLGVSVFGLRLSYEDPTTLIQVLERLQQKGLFSKGSHIAEFRNSDQSLNLSFLPPIPSIHLSK
jgi:hypothetical protein